MRNAHSPGVLRGSTRHVYIIQIDTCNITQSNVKLLVALGHARSCDTTSTIATLRTLSFLIWNSGFGLAENSYRISIAFVSREVYGNISQTKFRVFPLVKWQL